jgi:probable selenium-dependent hydroxylase accessory protein YqeC
MVFQKNDSIAQLISDYISRPSLITITGSGGKTSLMFALARYLRKKGSVLTTTTTKICRPYPYDADEYLISENPVSDLRDAVSRAKHVVVGDSIKNSKLIGIAPEQADVFFQDKCAEYILAECDGSRGLPFKAYEHYEPVIPSRSTLHLVVVGSEILYSPLSSENVFRFDLLKKRWDVKDGEIISIDTLANILDSSSEYLKCSPNNVARVLVFNKCDLLFNGDKQQINEIATKFTSLLRQYDVLIFASFKYDSYYEIFNLRL